MIGFLSKNISHKITILFIASALAVVTFSCFTAATKHGGHIFDVGAVCETVTTMAGDAVIQTGLVLLLVVATACFCFSSFNPFYQRDTLTALQVFHSPPPDYLVSPQEYSYLRELFSSGVIHTKLHSVF